MKKKIEIKFSRAHTAVGAGITNSVAPLYHYREERPDSILFRNNKLLKVLNDNLSNRISRLPMDYSRDSGMYTIPATSCIEFLEALKEVASKYQDKIFVSKNNLENLIDKLKELNYLTTEQAIEYKNQIPSIYTLEDMENDARYSKNPMLAYEVAIKHKEKNASGFYNPIDWLLNAIEFDIEKRYITLDNIQDLLENIGTAKINRLLHHGTENAIMLLDEIAKCPSITRIYFGTFFDPSCVNQHFTEFLKKANYLKALDMGATWSAEDRMRPHHIKYLAEGMKFNTSVEEIRLCDQYVGDEGLLKLITALEKNSNNKLKTLNLFCSGISNSGAIKLLQYMEGNKPLTNVNLYYNSRVSDETNKDIQQLASVKRGKMPPAFFRKYKLKEKQLTARSVAHAIWLEDKNPISTDKNIQRFSLWAGKKNIDFGVKEVKQELDRTYVLKR